MAKRTIEWHEHPGLERIEKWIEENLPLDMPRDFANNAYDNSRSLHDFKHTATGWMGKQINLLAELAKMINDLPDLDTAMIEVDESEC